MIEIDHSSPSSDSPEIRKRLDRIEQNYLQLEEILSKLESKIASDERLVAMDNDEIDFESEFGIKRKRKWRPAKSKSRSTRKKPTKKTVAANAPTKPTQSANPRKPR